MFLFRGKLLQLRTGQFLKGPDGKTLISFTGEKTHLFLSATKTETFRERIKESSWRRKRRDAANNGPAAPLHDGHDKRCSCTSRSVFFCMFQSRTQTDSTCHSNKKVASKQQHPHFPVSFLLVFCRKMEKFHPQVSDLELY